MPDRLEQLRRKLRAIISRLEERYVLLLQEKLDALQDSIEELQEERAAEHERTVLEFYRVRDLALTTAPTLGSMCRCVLAPDQAQDWGEASASLVYNDQGAVVGLGDFTWAPVKTRESRPVLAPPSDRLPTVRVHR